MNLVRISVRLVVGFSAWSTSLAALAAVPVAQTFSADSTADQDDMTLWLHPLDPGKSTLIASDKSAGLVVVYGLDGQAIQVIESPKPGNIDIRHDVQWGDQCSDVVVVNERDLEVLTVYVVDPASGELERVDDGSIDTGQNYGVALHRVDAQTLFAYTGPENVTNVRQYELHLGEDSTVQGSPTGWAFEASQIEGMVADDQAGWVFLGEESTGIWRVDAFDATAFELIAEVGDASGLATDVEGLTIYHASATDGYLIASSQGADKFTVLDRVAPHEPLGEFTIAGVGSTDGIDVLEVSLAPHFPSGIFAAHNGDDCCPVQAVHWEDVAAEVGGLEVSTRGYSPRQGCIDEPGGGTGTGGSETDSDGSGSAGETGRPSGGSDSGPSTTSDTGPGQGETGSDPGGSSGGSSGAPAGPDGSDGSTQAGCGCTHAPGGPHPLGFGLLGGTWFWYGRRRLRTRPR